MLFTVVIPSYCNTIMSGETTRAASKERMVSDLMLSCERMPQLSLLSEK